MYLSSILRRQKLQNESDLSRTEADDIALLNAAVRSADLKGRL